MNIDKQQINETLSQHFKISHPSLSEKSVEALVLMSQGTTQKDVSDITGLKQSNVARISSSYSSALREAKEIYKDWCLANNIETVETQKESVKGMIRKAKSLDYIYFQLLCQSVEDETLSPSVRMSAYNNLQAFLSRVKDGDTQLNKDNPSVNLEADSEDLQGGSTTPKGLPSIEELLARRNKQ
ncbi:hypothetical protein NDZ80_001609 [Vibrio vulnificus]|nr:hypothetical protein [Vibrio vulnificus]